MNLNGAEYFYLRNAQGDIIGLIDGDGVRVVSYAYDSWGKLISIKDKDSKDVTTDTNHVGYKNPYRYRGYRYDNETSLYYLQSRYYNPEWGRFLNADALAGTVGDLLSHNIFAYCGNNPINIKDPNGYFWKKVMDFFNNIFGGNKKDDEVDAIAGAATVIWGKFIDLDKGYEARFDKPHVANDQDHVHIYKKGKEVANQNDDGTPHHPKKNKPGEPRNSVKKKLKEKTGWDWDGKIKPAKVQFEDVYSRPLPFLPMPVLSPVSAPVPMPMPIPIFP
ncbi:RHS repeat domain-containing protein [Desnuesiella massiliensis]|uniref:RHS repeat domain-containing protein n=1 Tax=Desnuesiella massiliensis TaxID=1650662 RepID=UPI0006E429CA|nr:RHS repeat-associated core domain-containing protein [Desnuesiella massiliensis]